MVSHRLLAQTVFILCILSAAISSCQPPDTQQTDTPQAFVAGLVFLDPDVYNSIPLATAPAGGSLPASVDLSGDMPPAGNQGGSASCVGWAVGYGLKSYQERIERHWVLDGADHLFSPSFIYNQAKISAGCQGGSRLLDAFNILSEKGCCPLSDMPFDGDSCDTPPTEVQLQVARNYRIATWRRVNQLDPTEVKAHLAAGVPVVIALRLYASIYELAAAGADAVYDVPTGAVLGGHAALAVGYDDSTRRYKVLNSFGPTWGDHGYFYVSYDAWAMVVREAYVAQDEEAPTGPADSSGSGSEFASLYTLKSCISCHRSWGEQVAQGDPPGVGGMLLDGSWNRAYDHDSYLVALSSAERQTLANGLGIVATHEQAGGAQYVVNISVYGEGAVLLDPPGGTYTAGTVVTLTAVSDGGSHFAAWTGDLSGTANPGTLLMDSTKYCSAIFDKDTDDHCSAAECATPLTIGVAVPGVIDYASDNDSFVFEAIVGTFYTLEVITESPWACLLWGTDNGSVGGVCGMSRVDHRTVIEWWSPPETGRYYLGVYFMDERLGSYDILVTAH